MVAIRQANPISSIARTGEGTGQSEPLSQRVNVVLIGGDALYREGVKSLLNRNGLAVVGEFDTMTASGSLSPGGQEPAVVLAVSPDLAGPSARNWRQQFTDRWPRARVLVLAHPGEDGTLAAALRAGADGCLFTDVSADALIQSIRLVALGEGLFPSRLGALLAQAGASCARPRLTPRERDILRGLLSGHSNKMIANDLGTTDMTVKAQLRHLLRKLGVANRTQAALWAREQGIAAELQN